MDKPPELVCVDNKSSSNVIELPDLHDYNYNPRPQFYAHIKRKLRAVTHLDVDRAGVEEAAHTLEAVLSE